MKNQYHIFEGTKRLQMVDSIELTRQSLMAYGPTHKHWCIAWSGGKDSSTLLTLVVWMITAGKVPAPQSLTVMYADTRLELSPLWFAAQEIMDELRHIGIEVKTVMAPLEKRFMTYILGRGVPPPNNNTFRWCTRQVKIYPMEHELEKLFAEKEEKIDAKFCCSECGVGAETMDKCKSCGSVRVVLVSVLEEAFGADYWREFGEKPFVTKRGKILMLTGVRQGESAIRDQRIVMSCGKDGAECGQGWYQETMPDQLCDTLAPILHWRVCHVWEWLKHWAPLPEYGDWSTAAIADAYGGDEAEEINARTGCIGCPLAQKDGALDTVTKQPKWAYLSPLKRLKPLWRELRKPENRLRKTGLEEGGKNKQRMGPLTMKARNMALTEVLAIQQEVNDAATKLDRPKIDILSSEEEAFIRQCWADNVWPNKWSGEEPTADTLMDIVYKDGSIQPLLFYGT